MPTSDQKLKELLFEVYSAGFEAGYAQDVDLATAYNHWWDVLKSQLHATD